MQPDFEFLGGLLDSVKSLIPDICIQRLLLLLKKDMAIGLSRTMISLSLNGLKKGWVRGQGVFDVEMPNFNKDYSASVDSMPVPVLRTK